MTKTSNQTPAATKGNIQAKKADESDSVQLKVEETMKEVKASDNGSLDKPNAPDDMHKHLQLDDPFGKRIASGNIFKHHQLDELREIVRTAIRQHSMTLVSGPPGVGKTTGVRSVTDELAINKFSVVYLGQDQNGANLVRRFTECLGLRAKGFRPNHVLQISQWLTDNLKNGGKQIVLVVDEAHLLDDQTLEDLRLLTNADYDRQSPLTLILLAQPWLRARLKSPFFEPLTQRLRYRYNLEGLGRDETEQYIRARLAAAGLDPELFSDEAIHQIFAYSEGIPRRINNFCSHILLRVRTANLSTVDVTLVKLIGDSLDN
jgi:type II secretory pathway predicted ATPase ExeA